LYQKHTTMTNLESPRNAYPRADYSLTGKLYDYDLKLGVKDPEGGRTVAIPAIFMDLVKKMAAAAGNYWQALHDQAFCVEQTK
jgi:hypothetical protein